MQAPTECRADGGRWVRRARPLLGTLVDIGASGADRESSANAIGAALERIAGIEANLSRFIATSVIARFNTARAGTRIAIDADAARVLDAAAALQAASGGLFDITLGSGATGWRCAAGVLHKLADGVALDLGGIGKGFAVDAAVEALAALRRRIRLGQCRRRPARVRRDGAHRPARRNRRRRAPLRHPRRRRVRDQPAAVAGRRRRAPVRHASVAAPECLWADALTKIVIASGDAGHPLLARFGAQAWLH